AMIARSLLLFPVNFFLLKSVALLSAREILPMAVRPWLAAFVMGVAVYLTATMLGVSLWQAPARLVAYVAVGAVAYCGSLFLLAPATCKRLYAFAESALKRSAG